MTLDQLRYFAAAARYEHVGKAARAIAISPSAISHAIAALEAELGQALFVRQGKRVYLSAHGKLLCERTRALLRSVDSLREELSSAEVQLTGHQRLSATHGLAGFLLAPAWAALQQKHGQLTADLYSRRTADIVRELAGGELDFGLGYSPLAHPEVEQQILSRGQLVVVVRRGHPLMHLSADERARALGRYPQAASKAFHGVENCEQHPILKRWKIDPEIALIFDSHEVAAAYLGASNAWALLPQWAFAALARQGLVLAISPASEGLAAPVSLAAMWPRSRPPGRILRALIAEVERLLAE